LDYLLLKYIPTGLGRKNWRGGFSYYNLQCVPWCKQ